MDLLLAVIVNDKFFPFEQTLQFDFAIDAFSEDIVAHVFFYDFEGELLLKVVGGMVNNPCRPFTNRTVNAICNAIDFNGVIIMEQHTSMIFML